MMSAQARIGSSSAHFTSIPLSPCSTRKWAALEGGGGPSPRGGISPRGPPEAGAGACPVVVGPPGCGEGEGTATGASCRGAPDGGCGGCAKLAVARNAAATPKHTDDLFKATLLSKDGRPINHGMRLAFRLEWMVPRPVGRSVKEQVAFWGTALRVPELPLEHRAQDVGHLHATARAFGLGARCGARPAHRWRSASSLRMSLEQVPALSRPQGASGRRPTRESVGRNEAWCLRARPCVCQRAAAGFSHWPVLVRAQPRNAWVDRPLGARNAST